MKKYIIILFISIFNVHFISAKPLPLENYPKILQDSVKDDFGESYIDSLKFYLFNNEDNEVRHRAVRLLFVALNKNKNIRVNDINDLLANYIKEKDENIKSEIINCLWVISEKEKDSRILNLAIDIIKSPNKDLTKALIIVNNFGGDKRVEDKLIEFVEKGPDENYFYQEATLKCLSTMKSEKAVPIIYEKLIALLKNKSDKLFNVQTDYQAALIPSPSLGQVYIYIYIGGLSKIGGDKVVSLVTPLIDDNDLTIRQNAAMILGYICDARTVPVLCDIVINSKDPNMRTCAIYYLSNIGDKKAIPALKRALNDGYRDMLENYHPLRYDAYKALQKLGVKVERIGSDNYKVIE